MMVNAGNQICEKFQYDEVGNQSNVVLSRVRDGIGKGVNLKKLN